MEVANPEKRAGNVIRRVAMTAAAVTVLALVVVLIWRLGVANPARPQDADSAGLAVPQPTVEFKSGGAAANEPRTVPPEQAPPASIQAALSSSSLVIGASPPSFKSTQPSNAAAFAAEPVDPDWRARKWKELAESLTVIAHELKSAQIDCKSTMCTVELVPLNPQKPKEHEPRLRKLAEETRKLGFLRGDTEFFMGGEASLTYLSTRRVSPAAALPPEFPPELGESFRQALQTADPKQSSEPPEQAAGPRTWTGKGP